MIKKLKQTREVLGLAQNQAARIIGIPIRTLRRYELDESYGSDFKRKQFIKILEDRCQVNEEKGLLTIEEIKSKLSSLFDDKYKGTVEFCYLFGSYAKGYANEKSDVDLCISSSLSGLRVAGLAEAIRSVLHKRIDLVRFDSLRDNLELINEIMRDGIKVYK